MRFAYAALAVLLTLPVAAQTPLTGTTGQPTVQTPPLSGTSAGPALPSTPAQTAPLSLPRRRPAGAPACRWQSGSRRRTRRMTVT